jgi:AcrR family transcriptional regulator
MYHEPMPKVSQQYRDARRDQILQAAKRCFLRNGLQATSMQDLFAESGLSSGSFYLYFKSKDDVILAIVEENLSAVLDLIHDLVTKPHDDGLGEALASVLDTVRAKQRDDQLGELAVLAWSEALRSPNLRESLNVSFGRMRADFARVIAKHQSDGSLPDSVKAAAIAKLVMAIVPGVILQLALFGEHAADGVASAARAIWPG